ncbi:MAG: ABC transporter permease [Chloroflexi bacterium]|nr:MAG: ABC transporter permease [Chloroflexota bacterium]
MNIQLTLAARYLNGRKLRTFLTTLAIVFGVLVIFGLNTLLPAFFNAFQANIMAASGQVDATITLVTADAFNESEAGKVATVEGVISVSGFLDRVINVTPDYYDTDPAKQDVINALTLVGIDPDQATTIHTYPIVEGRFLQQGDTRAAVISESLADALQVGLGDTLRLPSAQGEMELEVTGIMPARALPGNEEVYVTLEQAQTMFNMPGKINTIQANFDTINEEERAKIEQSILEVLGENFQVGTLSANSELLANISVAQTIFLLLGILALLMGGFIIFNTFRTIVAERRRDIGMLRALGANRTTIFGIIATEGLVQGILGTAVGLVSGYLLGLLMVRVLSPIMMQFLNAKVGPPVVTPGLIIGSFAIGVSVTLLAGLLPALSASKVMPLEALRPQVGAISIRKMAGLGFWSGAIMIVLAVAALLTRNPGLIGVGGVLFVFGLILVAPALVNPIANLFGRLAALIFARDGTAQLAEGNLSRQPGRAAITASTTLIAMAILVTAASIISSVTLGFGRVLRKSIGSDFILLPPSVSLWGTNVGAGPEFAEELRSVDGVSLVSTLRFAPTQANNVAASILGIDPVSYPQISGLDFSKGDETNVYESLKEGRSIIINGVLAQSAGVGIGEEIKLVTPEGQKLYRVVAIANDFLNAKISTEYISQEDMEADFNRNEDILLQINLAQSVDRPTAENALRQVVLKYPQFRMIDGQEYIAESLRLFDAAFAGLIALVIFLAVPSLIATVNTLAIGVIERTREIGMLRAVGATRTQVRTIIVVEALILAMIGTALGLLSGLYLGYLTVETIRILGFPMEYLFPVSGIIMALSTGIIFGVIAAIIPARQAARLEIVQALRYE